MAWYCDLSIRLFNCEVYCMKLTLDVENTTTKRDGKLHLDPFEPTNKLVMVGCLTDKGEEYLYRDNFDGVQELLDKLLY